MRNLLNRRKFEEELSDRENYFGHATCSQCVWYDEYNEKCTYRDYMREKGITKFGKNEGTDKTPIFPSSDGCDSWFD